MRVRSRRRPVAVLTTGMVLVTSAVVGAGGEAAAGTSRPRPDGPRSVSTVHTWRGDQTGERFGWAVSQLADIDGDRVMEAVIGAPFHRNEAGVTTGHTDVRSGRTGELIYRFDGQPEDRHGYSMADAGDVNRDGVTDIVVGASGVSALVCNAAPRTGRIYVYSGATGAELLRVDGEAVGDQFGAAVGAAGDVDGDRRADLLVGAPCHDGPAGTDAGRAYVISGRTGAALRAYDGAEAGDGFGWGAAGLGDVTGDHRTDYIVGAKDAGPGDRGLAYVYEGRRGGLERVLAGDARSMEFGWFFVAAAGDVNRDGRPDIYVGDFCAEDDVGACTLPLGQAYVFSGRTGRLLHMFRGEQPGDGAGPGRSAGDVDRDGRADVVVGLYASSAQAPQGGRLVVYSGRTGEKLVDYAGTVAGELLGYDAVGLGDVNRDGHVDLLVSAAAGDAVYVLGT
jgi:hypothetical protein